MRVLKSINASYSFKKYNFLSLICVLNIIACMKILSFEKVSIYTVIYSFAYSVYILFMLPFIRLISGNYTPLFLLACIIAICFINKLYFLRLLMLLFLIIFMPFSLFFLVPDETNLIIWKRYTLVFSIFLSMCMQLLSIHLEQVASKTN